MELRPGLLAEDVIGRMGERGLLGGRREGNAGRLPGRRGHGGDRGGPGVSVRSAGRVQGRFAWRGKSSCSSAPLAVIHE